MNFSDERTWRPTTYWCDEILKHPIMVGLTCCEKCHSEDNSKLIMVYPRSGGGSNLPDCGLGVHALICCKLYDAVRGMPRAWWLGFYGVKHGYSAEDIKLLQEASETRDWLKVQSALGSKYFRLRNPSADYGRIDAHQSRSVGVSSRKVKTGSGKCPSCGQKWSGDVCDNCGHGGGI